MQALHTKHVRDLSKLESSWSRVEGASRWPVSQPICTRKSPEILVFTQDRAFLYAVGHTNLSAWHAKHALLAQAECVSNTRQVNAVWEHLLNHNMADMIRHGHWHGWMGRAYEWEVFKHKKNAQDAQGKCPGGCLGRPISERVSKWSAEGISHWSYLPSWDITQHTQHFFVFFFICYVKTDRFSPDSYECWCMTATCKLWGCGKTTSGVSILRPILQCYLMLCRRKVLRGSGYLVSG